MSCILRTKSPGSESDDEFDCPEEEMDQQEEKKKIV
jgi:hypothetical protein